MNRKRIGIILSLALIVSNSTYNVSAATTVISNPLQATGIAVNNYKGTDKDTIVVTGLTSGDIVKLYSASIGLAAAYTSSPASGESVSFNSNILKSSGGTVYLSVTSTGKTESKKVAKPYVSEASTQILPAKITITNGFSTTNDIIEVIDLTPGDTINVYSAAAGGSYIATSSAGEGTSVSITTDKLKSTGGTVYLSVTSKDKAESKRTAKSYISEPVSDPTTVADVTVNNYKGVTSDSIIVSDLNSGDVVRVYTSATGKIPATSAVAGSDGVAKIDNTDDLKATNGTIYVSVAGTNELESKRIAKTYNSEISMGVKAKSISINNFFGQASDSISVSGLDAGDLVQVYSAAVGGKVLASKTVATGSDSVTISPVDSADFKLNPKGGTVYISVTESGKAESKRVTQRYLTEPVSESLVPDEITIINNSGTTNDSITVDGVQTSDVVSLYTVSTGGVAFFSTVATGTSVETKTDKLDENGGTIYVTVTTSDKLESRRVAKKYASEYSTSLAPNDIAVNNIYMTASDTVVVSGLDSGDVVNIYSKAVGGSAVISSEATSDNATLTLNDTSLTSTGGTVYVSITKKDKGESKRIAKKYASEPVTTALSVEDIEVNNNLRTESGSNDNIVINGVVAGDEIRIYSASTGDTLLMPAQPVGAGKTSITIDTDQLKPEGGNIYVTVKKQDKLESQRIGKRYSSENSDPLAANKISVTNNYGSNDVVSVTGLNSGDVIFLYSSAKDTEAIGSQAVGANATSVSFGTSYLNSAGGTIYLSVSRVGKAESAKVAKSYATEPLTSQISPNSITINNDFGSTSDSIVVANVSSGSTVRIYSTATGGSAIVTATVPSSKNSVKIASSTNTPDVVLPDSVLSQKGGTIYITVQDDKKIESKRTSKNYDTEPVSTEIKADDITVNNYPDANDDTITVKGLNDQDVVTLYLSPTGGDAFSSATASGSSVAVIKPGVLKTNGADVLSANGGKVYITRKSKDHIESKRVAKAYDSQISKALAASAVKIENYYKDTTDTISITGVTSGDTVYIYSGTSDSTIMKTLNVTSSSISSSISGLNSTGGTLYVSVQNKDKAISTKTAVKYDSEPISRSIPLNAINIDNNSTADTITVTGLEVNDEVYVYSSATGGSASTAIVGTVTTGTSVTISTTLIATGGTSYISLKQHDKLEGLRTPKPYDTEISSVSLSAVTVNNYVGNSSDSIVVNGLATGDVINVYSAASGGTKVFSKTSTGTSVTITGENLFTDAVPSSPLLSTGGTVYLSVTRSGKTESTIVGKAYTTEPVSDNLSSAVVTVKNYETKSDNTIVVTGLASGDTIYGYDTSSGQVPLITATVATGATSVTITDTMMGFLPLNQNGGTVYLTVKNANKLESTAKTAVTYESAYSKPMSVSDITIFNDKNTANDKIVLTGVESGDVINVYSASTGGTSLLTTTAAGASVTVLGAQLVGTAELNTSGGTIYVEIKRDKKIVSNTRTAKQYYAEPTS